MPNNEFDIVEWMERHNVTEVNRIPLERAEGLTKKVDPVLKRKAEDVVPDDRPSSEFSWLGKWQEMGWAIRIYPKLTDDQWVSYGRRAGNCWDKGAFRYDPVKCLELLHELFPSHDLVLKWPRCTYRTKQERVGKVPLYLVCDAQAKHTEVRAQDVTGARVGIARCDDHKGLL
jgi:hypothetical protein